MLTMVYFHPLNLYPRESKFIEALNSMMTLSFATGFAHSTLTLVVLTVLSDSAFFAFVSFGNKHVFNKCLCKLFLKAKLP